MNKTGTPTTPAASAASSGPPLGDAARVFATKPTARVLAIVVLGVLVLRLALGGWTWRDLIVAGGILAFEPFTEWLIHVHLLHQLPRRVLGRDIDLLVSRKHRAHHADPKDLDLVFVPMPVIWLALVIGAVVPLLLAPTVRVAVTASLTSFAMLLTYEWTHYLIHSPYRPKRSLFRRLWRTHRWHHYRNEHYWFGVTMHTGDRVLRTYPDRDEVDLSPTARTLAVDA
jgi:hypothetical protein